MNNLTKGRVYGSVCPKHPELEGLRYAPRMRVRRRVDETISIAPRQGYCVGCQKDINDKKTAAKQSGASIPDGITFLAQVLGVSRVPNGRLSIKHRMELINEECDELYEAECADDLVGVADALTDIAYVVYGMAAQYGIDLDACFKEVHASNMSKLGEDGKPIYRADGKVLKGKNFRKPNLEQFAK